MNQDQPDDATLQRIEDLNHALDRELLHAPPPTPEMLEAEITDLVAEAPDLGADPADTEQHLRQMTYAFWRDWFAVDALVDSLKMTEEEVWNLCLAREAARSPTISGPQA